MNSVPPNKSIYPLNAAFYEVALEPNYLPIPAIGNFD